MRGAALGLAIAVAVVGLFGCNKLDGTVAKAPASGGIGGAGRAGGKPPEPINPKAIHPQSGQPIDENALTGTVHGKIVDTDFRKIVLMDPDGHRFWLTLSPNTVVTQNGQLSSALVLQEGAEATVVFHKEDSGNRQVISRADVTKAAASPVQPKQ